MQQRKKSDAVCLEIPLTKGMWGDIAYPCLKSLNQMFASCWEDLGKCGNSNNGDACCVFCMCGLCVGVTQGVCNIVSAAPAVAFTPVTLTLDCIYSMKNIPTYCCKAPDEQKMEPKLNQDAKKTQPEPQEMKQEIKEVKQSPTVSTTDLPLDAVQIVESNQQTPKLQQSFFKSPVNSTSNKSDVAQSVTMGMS